ncbi:hypothetical protein [Gracilimonas sp.]|uniref:hypothetical protein n=1 Tax=Gracilimonas sp. TaxID=1974203 RepID=UPI002872A049|nr:hypothetical protein [Gracilimonas sp.]
MKQFYKLTSIVILLLISSTLTLQAQEHEHSLIEGARAIQFQVNSNFTLGSFGGSALSYKRQLSEEKAQRFSLSFQSALRNRTFPNSSNDQETTDFGTDIAAIISWQNYVNPQDEVKAYYGYGPGISFGYNSNNLERVNDTITQDRLTLGVKAIGYSGVEWFISSSFSLHAEYRASFRATFESRKVITEDHQTSQETTDKYNENRFSLGSNGVRFGLSVYF